MKTDSRCWMIPAGLAVASALAGCGPDSTAGQGASDGRLRVVCTTTMIADLVRNIAGDAADVAGIMKPGEDPHIYTVRPRDAQRIAEADLVVMNGLHLESTLLHVVENNAKSEKAVVHLADTPAITSLDSEFLRGAPDPHCWFNVAYFRIYAERARDALVAADAENADTYRANAERYIAELDALHQWVAEQLATVPRAQRVMVTSHDAFQYFGKAYGIDVLAVIGISTEQQPKPQDIARIENLVRGRSVKALFIETSVSNTLNEIVRKVAARTGIRIGGTLYSDSLGLPDTAAGTYIGMVRHNTQTVVAALR